MHDITLEQCLALRNEQGTLVDVRSSGEFEEFHIPGSINIPLFSDDERSEVGTIYKQVSVEAAKERGLEIASAKLPALYKQFRELKGPIVIYCWRGGMRSRTMATVMTLMGMKVFRLNGGIRNYRQWVQDRLEHYVLEAPCIVIAGHTGTGKTELLTGLAQDGYPVLDLEGLAAHRGSIFGHIGLAPRNQKMFDALLVERLDELKLGHAPYIMLEGESRRLGKVMLPNFLMEAKQRGRVIQINMPTEERVRNLLKDYDPTQHKNEIIAAFERIHRRLHTPVAQQIRESLNLEQYEAAVALMLEHYYDPRYEHAALKYEQDAIEINASNVVEADHIIREQLKIKKYA
ncbi:tRNA 2-selenouridine(34) synthase MnmH [Paenibacillus marinisediminis]